MRYPLLLFMSVMMLSAVHAESDDSEKSSEEEKKAVPQEYMPIREEFVEAIRILYPRAADLAQTIRDLYPDRVVWIRPLPDSGDARNRIERALNRMEALTDASTVSVVNRNSPTNSIVDNNDDSDRDRDSDEGAGNENSRGIRRPYRDAESIQRRNRDEREVRALYPRAKPSELVFLSALPSSNILLVRAGSAKSLEKFKHLVMQLDKPAPQVLLEVRVLRVDVSDLQGWGLNIAGIFDNFQFSTTTGRPIIPETTHNLLEDFPAGTSLFSSTTNTMHFGNNNIQLDVEASSILQRITELTTPTLLVADNEASRLFIGTEATILQKASRGAIIVGGTSTTTSSTWAVDAPRRNIGTSLVITPEIHADRSVTVRINYEKSEVGAERIYKFPEEWGTIGVNNNLGSGTSMEETSIKGFQFTSYDLESSMIATSVVARDGGLILLGGLISEGVTKYSNGIPGLMDLPILGELLFTKVQERRKRYETVILIRPYIISVPEPDVEKRINDFLFALSQHPSAKAELPPLGATTPAEIAKPQKETETSWYMHPITSWLFSWKVNTIDPPASQKKGPHADKVTP